MTASTGPKKPHIRLTTTSSKDEFDKKVAKLYGVHFKVNNTIFVVNNHDDITVAKDQEVTNLESIVSIEGRKLFYHFKIPRDGNFVAR